MRSARQIRGWLLRKPKPAKLRLTKDGESELMPFGKSAAATAESIEAFEPELLEALDQAGDVLRVTRMVERMRGEEPEVELPAALATDPNAAMLLLFGKLLAGAYRHATQTAFEKMVDLTEAMGQRTDSIESRLERAETQWRRAVRDQMDDQWDHLAELQEKLAAQATEEDDPMKQMAATFVQAAMESKARGGSKKGNPNGKAS